MELATCPNCLSLFGGVQDVCPACGADSDGSGADVEFDVGTRAAIRTLGGLFGGILEVENGAWLLWCSRGVCLVRSETGLVWRARARGRVEDVRVGAAEVALVIGGERAVLDLDDGSQKD